MTGEESLKLMSAADPWAWAFINKIKLQTGDFVKSGFEFLIEPMQSKAKKKIVMKATQGGWTQAFVLNSIHGLIHNRYPLGVLYLFPTSDLVSDFSSSRFDPLIADNPEVVGKYVQSTDRVGLKQIGHGYLYLRGARLSQKMSGEEKQSAKLSSIPVDMVVFDELDFMAEDAIPKALARMGASRVKEEIYLGNPTIPDYGIDKEYQNSDRRVWMIRCEKCNTETCLELEFPNCVKMKNDGTGFRACRKCGEEIYTCNGQWVAQSPNADYEGYSWSKLNSSTIDPGSILRAYSDPDSTSFSVADVHRLMLGKAYIGQEDRLNINDVYACCGNDLMLVNETQPCAMGVDVGKTLHVVIGIKTGSRRYEIIKVANLSGWNELHDLTKTFNIKCCVIDLMNEMHKAREFQKQENYPIFLCTYSEYQNIGPKWDLEKGSIVTNRTEIFDLTHSMVVTPGMFKLPRVCSEVKEYAEQMCAVAKTMEEDKLTGGKTFRYRKLGPDHYRNSTNYFYLAAQRIPIAETRGPRFHKRPMVAKTQSIVLGTSVGNW